MSDAFTDDFIKAAQSLDKFELPAELSEQFDVLECLASNELCDTYLLSEKDSSIKYVLKCYSKNNLASEYSEAKLLSGLSHSGFPALKSENENNTHIFVLREYANGMPLDYYLSEYGVFSISQALSIIFNLCETLSYLHSQSPPIIHRDIKPSNIIYNPNTGKVTLIDFGISRRYSEDSDSDTVNLGTKKFAPPEQYGFSQTDCRADIYALGVLFRFMLTGFVDGDINDKKLDQIISKCSAFSPKDRFQDIGSVKSALIKYKPGSKKMPLRIAALAIIICFFSAAIFQAFKNTNTSPTEPDPAAAPESAGRLNNNPQGISTDEEINAGENDYNFSDPFVEAAVRVSLGKSKTEPIYISDLNAVEVLGFAWELAVASRDEFIPISLAEQINNNSTKPSGALKNLSDLVYMPNLREIYLGGQEISDLSPLESCIQLTNVQVIRCPMVKDISFLSSSPRIWEFISYDTGIEDISALAKLPNLRALFLNGGFIKDLSPLRQMTALDCASLFNLPMSSPAELKNLPNLHSLTIRGIQLESLEGIENLKGLQYLDIAYTAVKDFSLLANHSAIKQLKISSDMEKNLQSASHNNYQLIIETPDGTDTVVFNEALIEKAVRHTLGFNDEQPITLQDLSTVQALYIAGNDIISTWEEYMILTGWDGHICGRFYLEPSSSNTSGIQSLADLAGMTNLTKLAIIAQNISDMSAISELPLEYLALCGNPITDTAVSPLKNCPSLCDLYIDGSDISDLSCLREFSNLKDLSIRHTKVSSLQPLEGLNIERLCLPTNIEDLTPLEKLPLKGLNLVQYPNDIDFICSLSNLESLFYSESRISSIEPFIRLGNLKVLALSNNNIADLSGLAQLTQLRQLTADSNPVTDISVVSNHPSLEVLEIRNCPIGDVSPLFDAAQLRIVALDSRLSQKIIAENSNYNFHMDINR